MANTWCGIPTSQISPRPVPLVCSGSGSGSGCRVYNFPGTTQSHLGHPPKQQEHHHLADFLCEVPGGPQAQARARVCRRDAGPTQWHQQLSTRVSENACFRVWFTRAPRRCCPHTEAGFRGTQHCCCCYLTVGTEHAYRTVLRTWYSGVVSYS